ncbi:MAG: sel1 repeat family protein [Paludibacteraceae bacterium]|nr:sel1 repeat family protein [Paludibacteraceae bacterium]
MKNLIYISILVAAFFWSCNSKPGARAKVPTSRINDTTETTPINGDLYGIQSQNAQSAPGEDFYAQATQAYESGNKQEALRLCRKSADLGFAPAQFNMAIFYYNGDGVQKDLTKTVEWLEKSAPQGFLQAQKQLAICYAQGIGTAKDAKKAAFWYEKAAQQGDADAQYKIGTAYYRGNGVIPDYEQAVKWYEKAAAQGVSEAMNDLGLCYENGLGVSRLNPHKALELYQKAANMGNKIAKSNYDRLKKTLSESQIIYEM